MESWLSWHWQGEHLNWSRRMPRPFKTRLRFAIWMQFEWNLNGIWMVFEWNLNGIWMNALAQGKYVKDWEAATALKSGKYWDSSLFSFAGNVGKLLKHFRFSPLWLWMHGYAWRNMNRSRRLARYPPGFDNILILWNLETLDCRKCLYLGLWHNNWVNLKRNSRVNH